MILNHNHSSLLLTSCLLMVFPSHNFRPLFCIPLYVPANIMYVYLSPSGLQIRRAVVYYISSQTPHVRRIYTYIHTHTHTYTHTHVHTSTHTHTHTRTYVHTYIHTHTHTHVHTSTHTYTHTHTTLAADLSKQLHPDIHF
jgi:hypothetical protein